MHKKYEHKNTRYITYVRTTSAEEWIEEFLPGRRKMFQPKANCTLEGCYGLIYRPTAKRKKKREKEDCVRWGKMKKVLVG